MKWNQVIFVCCVAGCSLACTSLAVYDAERVVAQADSLRAEGRMYGVDEGDSLTLAQAYETLKNHSAFSRQLSDLFPFVHCTSSLDTYAHACYHYGRLLREKDNPVEAMQVFINATHTNTRDFHILGRIYSNMGDIAHLAGDYPLSYDMYEKSGDMFLHNGDTISYYYCRNSMAFELAEQGKKEEALALLSTVEERCSDKNIHARLWETKAKLYLQIQQYDSVLHAVYHLHHLGNNQPTGYVLQARALWHLGQIDSALYYAQRVEKMPEASDQNRYNMLYILLNGDSTLLPEEIKSLSEKRADLEALKLVPKHKKDAVAANLLHQDQKKIPDSILICIWSLAIICSIMILWLYAKKIQKVKKQQQEAYKSTQRQQLSIYQQKMEEIEKACSAIGSNKNWQEVIHWKDYDPLCEFIDTHFFFFAHILKEKHVLNDKEIRLCILVLLGGFSDKQMADILCYSEKSIRSIKRITAQKLGTSSAKLRSFLIEMLLGKSSQ